MQIIFDTEKDGKGQAAALCVILGDMFGFKVAFDGKSSTSAPAITVAAPEGAAEKLLNAVAAQKVATNPTPAADVKGPIHWDLLDSAGMPWDERIHSSAKSTLADGTWKLLRKLEQTLVDACRLEVMDARAEGGAAPAEAPAAPAAPAPEPEPEVLGPLIPTELAGEFSLEDYIAQGWDEDGLIENGYFTRAEAPKPAPAPAAPAAPKAPVAPAAPAAPKAATEESQSDRFTRVMKTAQEIQKAGKATGADLQAIYKAAGLNTVAQAVSNPAALAQIDAALTEIMGA